MIGRSRHLLINILAKYEERADKIKRWAGRGTPWTMKHTSAYGESSRHLKNRISWVRTVFKWVPKEINNCFGFTWTVIGPENRRHLLNQSDLKVRNKRDLVVRVFPRFKEFGCFHFKFSLATGSLYLSFDWSLGWLVLVFRLTTMLYGTIANQKSNQSKASEVTTQWKFRKFIGDKFLAQKRCASFTNEV